MKLTSDQIKKIILEELRQSIGESYGDLGPDDETEEEYIGSIDWQRDQDDANRSSESERRHNSEMKRDEFIQTQYMSWVKELNRGNPEDLEKIVEVLEEAYDKLGEAFELDGYVEW